jgi:hypothetical protein
MAFLKENQNTNYVWKLSYLFAPLTYQHLHYEIMPGCSSFSGHSVPTTLFFKEATMHVTRETLFVQVHIYISGGEHLVRL